MANDLREWLLGMPLITGIAATRAVPILFAISSLPSEWSVLGSLYSAVGLSGIIWGDWYLNNAFNTLKLFAVFRGKPSFMIITKIGQTLVYTACCFGWFVIFFPNVMTDPPSVALWKAVKHGNIETVQRLVPHFGVNWKERMQNAILLHVAAINGHTTLVNLLIASGAAELTECSNILEIFQKYKS